MVSLHFLLKKIKTFLVITVSRQFCSVAPFYPEKTDELFSHHPLPSDELSSELSPFSFHWGVTPWEGVTPAFS